MVVVMNVQALIERFRTDLAKASTPAELDEVRRAHSGKKSSIKAAFKDLRHVEKEQRPAVAAALNQAQTQIEAELDAAQSVITARALAAQLDGEWMDLSMPGLAQARGARHPLTKVENQCMGVLRRLGFSLVEGPEIEHAYYNFDALNIPEHHPARDMQDTFFVRPRSDARLVLRTHTSPVQVRTMLAHEPPIRVVAPGTVFRKDDDATHSPMFHQLEGLFVDRHVTMADLKATLYRFVGEFFGEGLNVRLRPSYFPFVEPGAEVDMQCPFCREEASGASVGCGLCKGTTWIEIAGSGMVHPHVFESCGIDPERYTGWAFGLGLDRMAMLKYAVTHLRLFFDGDVRFLEQFPC